MYLLLFNVFNIYIDSWNAFKSPYANERPPSPAGQRKKERNGLLRITSDRNHPHTMIFDWAPHLHIYMHRLQHMHVHIIFYIRVHLFESVAGRGVHKGGGLICIRQQEEAGAWCKGIEISGPLFLLYLFLLFLLFLFSIKYFNN